jgi:glutathione synthase/RimK-type ligase-like ATP-grasp enzyme
MTTKRNFLFFLKKSFSDKAYIRIRYLFIFRRFPNLKKPKTFNEKINWLKLNYNNVELTKFADKYEVRKYIKKQIGERYLNTIYGVYSSVDEIDWDLLPQKFVLKATHGSGWVILCKSKSLLDKQKAVLEMNYWLSQNYYDLWGEKVYKYIPPRIICEKYLEGIQEQGMVDYKFYCFNGNPLFLHVDVNRHNDQHYINFYDLEWNKLPIRKGYPNSRKMDPKPESLDEMINIAKKLSRNLPFVRVDLYEEKGRVLFGELTFYPQNGLSSFYPKKYEREFGSFIKLENIKKQKKTFFSSPSWHMLHRGRYILSKYSGFEKLITQMKLKRGDFMDDDFIKYMNSADQVLLNKITPLKLPKVGLVKDIDNYGTFIQKRSHWPKYERFLINNKIPYSFLDIHASDWMEKSKEFDIIIFRPDNSPSGVDEAKTKINFIEKYLNKFCFPNSREIWAYEDKVRLNFLYQHFNIPHIKTFISNSKSETEAYIKKCSYPFVSKISCGSVSRGVQLIRNKRQAEKLVNKVFAEGRKTYWTEQRQKNYVYFQEFIHDAFFDLRIIVVQNKITGYYRLTPENDFRASGAGIWQLNVSELPEAAMELAVKVKEDLELTVVAVDLIKPKGLKEFLVIESSVFFDVDFPSELFINDVPGYYLWEKKNGRISFDFQSGNYWIQELIALELVKKYQNQISQDSS